MMRSNNFISRGILAGIAISIGGTIYLKIGGVAGAVLFAFGLIAVVSMGLNLFTGKAQFVWGRGESGEFKQGGHVWLFSILALNIIGCMICARAMQSADMMESAVSILDKRLSNNLLRNGILAMGCGFIMTLAVQNAAKGKWLPLLFGIPAFIICGFPHCVADAFYIASLPWDYVANNGGDLAAFYAVIVAGNYVGCNLYRLLEPGRLSWSWR